MLNYWWTKTTFYIRKFSYISLWKFTIDSECLRSLSDTSRTEFLCEADACLIEPEAIQAINGNSRELSWTAGNHSDFWGRKLEDGLVYRLGTLEPEKFVRKWNFFVSLWARIDVSLTLMDALLLLLLLLSRCWQCIPLSKNTNGILCPPVSTGGSSGATPYKTSGTKDGMNFCANQSFQSTVLHATCYGQTGVERLGPFQLRPWQQIDYPFKHAAMKSIRFPCRTS